ncbi:hypothetical protein [Neisseria meningitidis]|uniref:hypothetical protein n=1 Tax=Neisseria meningitidis TaxID=487 RepID=UPI0018643EDB|nr:hypothetical protein [Neisseria meningitidis]
MPSETQEAVCIRVSDGIARYGRYRGNGGKRFYWNLPYPLPDTEASNKAFRSDGSDCLV